MEEVIAHALLLGNKFKPYSLPVQAIKVPLNNVIQDTQLSPRISMVTNVPACTVSLARQADTKETKEENLHKSN